jgi:hypothetical protein
MFHIGAPELIVVAAIVPLSLEGTNPMTIAYANLALLQMPGRGLLGPILMYGVIIFAFFIVAGLSRKGGRARISGPTLVLRKFNLNESAPDGLVVDIEGRESGVISWILTVLGLDAITTLKTTGTELSFRSSSLFGQIHRVASLPNISSTHCGYSKPIGYLIIGVLIGLAGVVAGFALSAAHASGSGLVGLSLIVIGLVFIVAYFLSKKLAISVETSGGMVMGLTFKRSVIENVPVDIEKAFLAIQLINRQVVQAQMKTV